MTANPMALGLFVLGHGHNLGSWRAPGSFAADLLGPDYYVKLAKEAERGALDLVFFAEILYAYDHPEMAFPTLDPMVLIPTVAAATSNIGLVGTYSTTYTDARATALKLATIDRLNHGRTGWNMVTTGADRSAANFSRREHPEREARYARADLYAREVKDHWSHWPASPQGSPVLVQAGMSPFGKAFAATHAEVMFTVSRSLADGQKFRTELRNLATEAGRNPDHVRVMPGIAPILGGTEAEAQAKEDEYFELVHPRIQLALLSDQFSMDFSPFPIDGPLPLDAILDSPNVKSGARDPARLIEETKNGMPTLREYLRQSARVRAHQSFVGTPDQLAAHMADWHAQGACDGWNVMLPVQLSAQNGGVTQLVDEVVPLLRKRGVLRDGYAGATLRENLGLPVTAKELEQA